MSATATASSQVWVRDNYPVPAIPADVLKGVYGTRVPDQKVAQIVSIFEYFKSPGVPRSILHDRMLPAIKGTITRSNVNDFISLLVVRGDIDALVDIIEYPVDRNFELRQYLEDCGADLLVIGYYASWGGIKPKSFIDGFVLGVGESLATAIVGIWDLVKIVAAAAQLFQDVVRTTAMALVEDLALGGAVIVAEVTYVSHAISQVITSLRETDFPAWLLKQWTDWHNDFQLKLSKLDSIGAGRKLGNLGGDLWQLIDGMIALAKLTGLVGKLSTKLAPIAIAAVRGAARAAANALRALVEVLVKVGRSVVDGVAKVGLGALETLFPPELIKLLYQEGRTWISRGRLGLMMVPAECYAGAYNVPMGQEFAAMVVAEGKPVMMAATTDKIPTLSSLEEQKLIGDVIAEIEEQRDLDAEALATVKELEGPQSAEALARAAKAMDDAEVSLKNRLSELLRKAAYDEFRALTKDGSRPLPKDLGNAAHSAMDEKAPALLEAVAPGAEHAQNEAMRTVIGKVTKITKRMQKMLDSTVLDVIRADKELMDLIGIGTKRGDRSADAVAKFIRDAFGWSRDTKVGALKGDFQFWDKRVRRFVNIDWTSAGNANRYEKLSAQVAKDLGRRFAGNWDELEEAYKAAGKTMPEGMLEDVAQTRTHALRETIVRRRLLEKVLGSKWRVSSVEMLYDALGKQYAEVAEEAAELTKAAEKIAAKIGETVQ
jgi:hypothetical protein